MRQSQDSLLLGLGLGNTIVHLQEVSRRKCVGQEASAILSPAFVSSHTLLFLSCRLARGRLLHPLPQWHVGLWL